MGAGPAPTLPTTEPVLDLDEIQGIVAPGFFKPHQVLLYLRFPEERRRMHAVRTALRLLVTYGVVSNARSTLEDRRNHRKHVRGMLPSMRRPPLAAMGFTSQGLRKLTPAVEDIASPAFQGGLLQRSAMLGDATVEGDDGHPSTWVVGAPGKELDAIIVVAGDRRSPVRALAREIEVALKGAYLEVELEFGDVRPDQPGHEHFGFDDGVSQPGMRGRASHAAHDFITERWLSPDDGADARRFGYPGQDLVWPGEFVLGYPGSSPDPELPGSIAPCPDWMRNGSFLVYRRLRQDVAGFWRTMGEQTERLRAKPGFEDWTAERLASTLVGRWPSGAPVVRTSDADDPILGADQRSNNDFRFDNASPRRSGQVPGSREPAPADPVGLICPAAAHIRKVNVRDCPSDMGGRIATLNRRLLRVGIAYGESLPDARSGKDDGKDRGLLFLSVQSSIEDQFEFLQARWVNNPGRPRGPGGHDMIIGQNAVADGGVRRCPVFGANAESAEVEASTQFVTATGGAYFFMPSMTALREVVLADRVGE